MTQYVLEVVGGSDIIAAVTRFCNQRNTGLCVLSGSGTVCNVHLRQPSTTISFLGPFELLSVFATVIPSSPSSAAHAPLGNGFTVTLAASEGQVVGGIIIGPLIATGTVHIIAAAFNNPLYY